MPQKIIRIRDIDEAAREKERKVSASCVRPNSSTNNANANTTRDIQAK